MMKGYSVVSLFNSQRNMYDVPRIPLVPGIPRNSSQTNKPRVTFEDNAGLVNVVSADDIIQLLDRKDVVDTDMRIGH